MPTVQKLGKTFAEKSEHIHPIPLIAFLDIQMINLSSQISAVLLFNFKGKTCCTWSRQSLEEYNIIEKMVEKTIFSLFAFSVWTQGTHNMRVVILAGPCSCCNRDFFDMSHNKTLGCIQGNSNIRFL